MTEQFSTVCEHCRTTLKLKNPDLVGKKVKCPKCGEAFVVSAPSSPKKPAKKKPADEDEGFMDVDPDEYGAVPEDDEFEDFDDQPVRRSSKTGKKKKGKKSRGKGDSAKVLTLVAIVLVAIGVLGGGGYGLMVLAKSASSDVDWLPAEIEGYAKIQADDLWKSGVAQPLVGTEMGKQFADEMIKKVGMGPQDIDVLVVGFSKNGPQGSEVTVIRSHQPFDVNKLHGPDEKVETVSHAGGQYVKSDSRALFLADSKTLVTGSESNIQSLMSRGKRNPSASKFGFASGCRDHLVVAMLNQGNAPTSAGAGPLMGLGATGSSAENILVRANASSDVSVAVQATFKTADMAKAEVDKAQSELTKGKTQFSQTKSQIQAMPANPLIKTDQLIKMMDGMEQVVNSTKVSQWGSQMNVQTTVSGQLVKDLIDMSSSIPFGFPGTSRFPSFLR